jgi:glutathione synthase/RimK-type ligase-like ATP-grasp enzyme
MPLLIVVNNPSDWPLQIPGVEVVSARSYLIDSAYSDMRNAKIFNLCRSYRYQSTGYYVSLLASARGHKPLPSITTIQDMKSATIVRFASDDLDDLIQKSLAPIQSNQFTLSIYFGHNLARRYDRLAMHLFNMFPAPLLRAHFTYSKKWQLQSIGPIAASEIPEEHRPFVVQVAGEYFSGRRGSVRRRAAARYDLAILVDADEKEPPSDERALRRFVKAADAFGFRTEMIGRDEYGRLGEFDALFIRETTAVNHHTYRFARRALAEGLVVIDDPDSIVKCTNKVYLAELLDCHDVPTPKTLMIHRDNVNTVRTELGLPCILKQPDSSFSQGVLKVEDEQTLAAQLDQLLDSSELVIAQEFLPTEFDWRVGVFDRQPFFVCKYYMAGNHWQIINRDHNGNKRYGKVEAVPVDRAPRRVVQTALRAANLIGNGLYGVDIKQCRGKCYVIEVNDNPNIDAGAEDAVLKDELYSRIMGVFLQRLEQLKQGNAKP